MKPIALAVIFAVIALLAPACGQVRRTCLADDECPGHTVCLDGACVAPGEGESESEAEAEAESEAEAEAESESESECGNGQVDAYESCDTALDADEPGACPEACEDEADDCVSLTLDASGCQTLCDHDVVTDATALDGCVAGPGDPDVPDTAVCGNSVIEEGETCDGNCPTSCDSGDACLAGALLSGGTCQAACAYWPLVTAVSDDGCCVPGATCETDEDCCPIECDEGELPAEPDDDGDPCTEDVLVVEGACAHTAHVAIAGCCDGADCCGDGVVEPGELCDEAGAGATACPQEEADCDAGDACTADDFVDGGDCLRRCDHDVLDDGAACDDDDLCNGAETCQTGECASGAAVLCDAPPECQTAVGATCDPGTGACDYPTVLDDTPCADADLCDGAETCQAGECASGAAVLCDAPPECHTSVGATCDPGTGACDYPTVLGDTPCADADLCDGAETCSAGACVAGTPVACTSPPACQTAAGATCSPATGACSYPALANGTSCADADLCDGAETCSAGACVAGTPVACTSPPACQTAAGATCSPATGACSYPALANGTSCDDGDLCNGVETCQSGVCTPGTAGAWSATSPTGAPSARDMMSFAWTGSELAVWGGRFADTCSAVVNTGALYDPLADTWREMSTSGAPSARYVATMVWTGTELIVWGGGTSCGSPPSTNTGGRYNPTTGVWSSVETAGAPSNRYSHTAVWTGSEMIIWGGGAGGVGGLDTGGRYNPTSNTWIATQTTGAPSLRYNHTAVWTGAEMIVWGGTPNAPTVLDTGGRYDPAANTWTALPTAGAPQARNSHTGVWTGDEMIVWGGNTGLAEPGAGLATGGRYRPSTNTWTATSVAGAPAARMFFPPVWTGSQMIVWGGWDGASALATGGKYDPLLDQWAATATTCAPSARRIHAAVWTGGEMIVWGGSVDPNTYLATGARYLP